MCSRKKQPKTWDYPVSDRDKRIFYKYVIRRLLQRGLDQKTAENQIQASSFVIMLETQAGYVLHRSVRYWADQVQLEHAERVRREQQTMEDKEDAP